MQFKRKQWYTFLIFLFIIMVISMWSFHDSIGSNYKTILRVINYESTYQRHFLPKDDYSRLINLTDFTFQIFENVCSETDPFLLVLVPSAPEHFQRRLTVRKTWGRNINDVKLAFLLGAVSDIRFQRELEEEDKKYRDLIQGNFMDTYKNLTYKHVMGLKYVTYHCPKAKYVLKVDDDVFVNMYALIDFLNEHFSPNGVSDLLFCSIMIYSPALRESKWAVSIEEYPDKFYPPYCSGFVLIYTPDVIYRLYEASSHTKYFWIEDVHVTGTLVKITKTNHTNAAKYILNYGNVLKILNGTSNNKDFLFGSPNLSDKVIRQLWKQVQY